MVIFDSNAERTNENIQIFNEQIQNLEKVISDIEGKKLLQAKEIFNVGKATRKQQNKSSILNTDIMVNEETKYKLSEVIKTQNQKIYDLKHKILSLKVVSIFSFLFISKHIEMSLSNR